LARTESTTGREGYAHASTTAPVATVRRLERVATSSQPVLAATVTSRPTRLPAVGGRASAMRASNGPRIMLEQEPERAPVPAARVSHFTVNSVLQPQTAPERRATTVGASSRSSTMLGKERSRTPAPGTSTGVRKTLFSHFTVNLFPSPQTAPERRATTLRTSSRFSNTLGQERSRTPVPSTSIGVQKGLTSEFTIVQPSPHHHDVLERRATTVGMSSRSHTTPGKQRSPAEALGTSVGSRVLVSTVNQDPAPHTPSERRATTTGASTRYSGMSGQERLRTAVLGTSTGLCNAQLSISDTTVNQSPYRHATMSERRATTVGTSSEGSFVAGQQLSPAAVLRSSDLTRR